MSRNLALEVSLCPSVHRFTNERRDYQPMVAAAALRCSPASYGTSITYNVSFGT